MGYLVYILVLICVYVVLSVSLDLLIGQTGILFVAQAVFFGLGAYTAALCSVRLHSSFFVSTLLALVAGIVFSPIASLLAVRLHGDYFIIATFALQMIASNIATNWISLTNGPLGIYGIPSPGIAGRNASFWIVTSALLLGALAILVVRRLAESPFGRVLRAIRADELFAASLGKNVPAFKITIFAVSSALAATAGSLYAHHVGFIDPSSFALPESVLLISMVVIGGAGSRWGAFSGAIVLVLLPEALRFANIPAAAAANIQQIIYGAALVLTMLLRPTGISGAVEVR